MKKKKHLKLYLKQNHTSSGVQKNLQQQKLITEEELQTDLAKKSTEIFVQEQNILALSGQITELIK